MHEKAKKTYPGDKNTWSAPAVTILCVFHFLLGAAAYKWMLWRWM